MCRVSRRDDLSSSFSLRLSWYNDVSYYVDKRFESLMSWWLIKLVIILKYFDRFITIMIYLNDVEEGGETAFPAANNKTYDEEVIVHRN